MRPITTPAHAEPHATPDTDTTVVPNWGPQRSILKDLYRPVASLGLAGLGGSIIMATSPPLAAAYWAAPALTKVGYLAGATALSYGLVSTPYEAMGALIGLIIGVAATAAFFPAALPAAYLLSGAGGATLGSLITRFPNQVFNFLKSLGGVILVAIVTLAVVTLYAAHMGYAAPGTNCLPLNTCPNPLICAVNA